jgi:penicillin-binding protein 1A
MTTSEPSESGPPGEGPSPAVGGGVAEASPGSGPIGDGGAGGGVAPAPAPEPAASDGTLAQGSAPGAPPSGPALGEAARALAVALGRDARQAGQRIGAALSDGTRRAAGATGLAMGSLGARLRGGSEALRARWAQTRAGAAGEPAAPRLRRAARLPGTRAIRRVWWLTLALVGAVVLGAALAVASVWGAMRDLPLADILPPLDAPAVVVQTASGDVLTRRGAYRAPYVGLEEMPETLAQAVIAIEDRRFREHGGVDWRGIGRALWRNASAGGVVQGGSTITQQLVKVLYLTPDRTIRRKLQEAVLATMLERQLGKDRILELYLNSVYLGAGAYGMPAAAETYFDKEVGELTLAESAMLAASIQLPSQVNPVADLAAAQERAALVVTLMQEQGLIDGAEREAALSQIARLAPRPPETRAGSYFADWVLRELSEIEGATREALSATATIDPVLQEAAERVVRDAIAAQGPAAGASQAALVAMTPDGRVRAMVGGVDYAASQFNRATDARRQPGSTFKLFVYLGALAMGATPDSRIDDSPIEIDGWRPENFGGRTHGRVTLREAFANSYNLAAVRLAQEVGLDNIIGVARQFGIDGPLSRTPSLALGTSEVTLLDLTEAYAAVAYGRAPVRATGVEAVRFGPSGTPMALRAQDAAETVTLNRTRGPMIEMMQAVVEQGTGRGAATGGFAAGKTGTSQDSRDAWFVGFDDRLVVGVWVGNDDNSPMNDVTGGGLPATIWRDFILASGGGTASAPPPATGEAEPQEATVAAVSGPVCNVRACAAAYRSFRAEDCTFQPYSGPRRLCTR